MVKILLIFVTVLLAVCLCFFAADFFPIFLSWIKRIHIGRYSDKKIWLSSVKKRAEKQAKKLPPLPVTDEMHYTLPAKIKGSYYNSKFTVWQMACLLSGLEKTDDINDIALRFLKRNDFCRIPYTPGTALFLYSVSNSGIASDESVKSVSEDYIKKALKAADGYALPYNVGQREQYVDVLGMVCPFLIKYHLMYGCNDAFELAKRQFDEFYAHGISEKTNLPVHCFNSDSLMPMGLYGWGRGCGWLALALDECIGLLDGKDDYADVLKGRAEQLIKALLPYQNDDGSFNSVVGVPFSRCDSSATAMIGGLLARMGYRKEAEKCLSYLMSVTRRNGEVDFAQGDTMGIGNYSRRFEPMPAAQGFALSLAKKLC